MDGPVDHDHAAAGSNNSGVHIFFQLVLHQHYNSHLAKVAASANLSRDLNLNKKIC